MEMTTRVTFVKFASLEEEVVAMNGLKKASDAKNLASKIRRLALAIGSNNPKAIRSVLAYHISDISFYKHYGTPLHLHDCGKSASRFSIIDCEYVVGFDFGVDSEHGDFRFLVMS
jgi:hypothetical protein